MKRQPPILAPLSATLPQPSPPAAVSATPGLSVASPRRNGGVRIRSGIPAVTGPRAAGCPEVVLFMRQYWIQTRAAGCGPTTVSVPGGSDYVQPHTENLGNQVEAHPLRLIDFTNEVTAPSGMNYAARPKDTHFREIIPD